MKKLEKVTTKKARYLTKAFQPVIVPICHFHSQMQKFLRMVFGGSWGLGQWANNADRWGYYVAYRGHTDSY